MYQLTRSLVIFLTFFILLISMYSYYIQDNFVKKIGGFSKCHSYDKITHGYDINDFNNEVF